MSCSCGHDHSPKTHLGRPDPAPGQVALSVRLICADAAQLATVLEYLPDHIALSQAEPGCLFFEAAQTGDPLIWQIEELYTDEAALDAHRARNQASIWAEKSSALAREIQRIDG